MNLTLSLLGFTLTIDLGPDEPEDDGPGGWATMSVTSDNERDYPIGYAPPDYDEEWRHR